MSDVVVPVQRVEPSGLDLRADYAEIYDDQNHDHEHLEALVDGVAVTATYTVPSARYLAAGTTRLAEALAEPYSLRTTADADAVLAALREQITGMAGVAAGLSAWLLAAGQRSELVGDAEGLRAQLDATAGALRAAGQPLTGLTAPVDASPSFDHEALVAGVTEQLQARGITVSRVRIFGDQTHWELDDGVVLLLFAGQGWDLIDDGAGLGAAPVGSLRDEGRLPYCQFVHPAHIADLVADALKRADQPA